MKRKKKKKKNNERPGKLKGFTLPKESARQVLGVAFFILAIIIGLSFFKQSGPAGQWLFTGLTFLIGQAVFSIPFILIIAGFVFFIGRYQKLLRPAAVAVIIFILGLSGFLSGLAPEDKMGGWLGFVVSWPLLKFFGFWVTQIVFGGVIIVSGIIFWHLFDLSFFVKEKALLNTRALAKGQDEALASSLGRALAKGQDEALASSLGRALAKVIRALLSFLSFAWLRLIRVNKDEALVSSSIKDIKRVVSLPKKISPLETKIPEITKEIDVNPQIKTIGVGFQPPPLNLLEKKREVPTAGDTEINSIIIKKTLENFNIPVEMSEINIGPTVTQYTFKPAEGIKLSKITGLANDLSLALACHPIRIEAPVPGKSLVGVEVPNKGRAYVWLRDLIAGLGFQKSGSNLNFVLGKDVSGQFVYADLGRMPHLLVAGSTGAGKTIFLNSLILSFLYQNSPEMLRVILIDPKRVEFSAYQGLPHLLTPVIFDSQKAINALKWLILEMERRFDVLSGNSSRNISSYNEKILKEKGTPMPYIVLIIDELADLMASRGREMEAGIVRLAQMARAVGIHLVMATQRPSVEVITGLIKANISSRITFKVASQVDSRTVLDVAGAEKLLGSGDLLFISSEFVKPRRVQGAYVTEKEVQKVVNYIKSKTKEEISEDEGLEKTLAGSTSLEDFHSQDESFVDDSLYEEAKRQVIEDKKASSSLLQRRLKIGYARAARLLDALEKKGVVGPGEGAKPREVYLPRETKDEIDEDGWQKV